jgi:hypothetical protein
MSSSICERMRSTRRASSAGRVRRLVARYTAAYLTTMSLRLDEQTLKS